MPRKVLPIRLALLGLLVLTSHGAWAQPASGSPEAAFAEAVAFYEGGLYGEAARAFAVFRSAFPNHSRYPDALYFGARAELANGRAARAAQLFAAFNRRYPRHPLSARARLALGEFYFARGDYDRAVTALRQALDEPQSAEESARTLLMIGHAGLRAARYEVGIRDLRRVAETFPHTEAAPRALYAIGAAAMAAGDYEEAADALGRLATRYRRTPEDRQVGLALAEAYLRTGQLHRVAPEVDRRLAELPGLEQEGGLPLPPAVAAERRARRDRALFLAGEALLRQGHHLAAEERLRAIDLEGPLARQALFGLGRSALDRGDWQAASDYFDRVAHTGPSDALAAQALYYGGLAAARTGQLELAGQRFAEATRRMPDGPYADMALFEHGILLYTTRHWDEAVRAFERLMSDYPTSTHAGEAARMLGETFAALGDFARAEAASRRAQELGAASAELAVEVDFQRGYRALLAGNFQEAEDILFGVYRASPHGERAGEALFWAAEAAFQLGQQGQRAAYTRALRRFESFLERFPEHRQRDAARYALAWTHFRTGDFARAAEAFERFLAAYRPDSEMVPYTSDARLRLADSYFALRRWDQAIAAYRRVVGPGADYAQFQIGQALANAGRLDEAIAAHTRFLATFPDSPLRPQARYVIGALRFQQGDYHQAISIFQEVLALHPGAPVAARAQFAIGDALYNQGRLQEAIAAYRAILDRFPQSPLVPDAISAIELALAALGREGELGRIVDSFTQQNPGVATLDEVRLRQAESRFLRGDSRGAIPELNALIAGARDREIVAPALIYLGRAHLNLGEAQAAERAFRRVLTEHPESPLRGEAARRLGGLLLQQQRFADAEPLFRTAFDLADTSAEAAEAGLGRASALIGLRRYGEAEPLLHAVMAEAPSSALLARARLLLASVYERTGRAEDALRTLESVALATDGAHGAEAAGRVVGLLRARGDAHRILTITDQLRVEERFSGFPDRVAEVLLARARAFRELGQSGRAQETFDRIVRAYPDTPAAAHARRERDV